MELFTRPDDVTESAGGSNNVLVRLPIKKLLYHGFPPMDHVEGQPDLILTHPQASPTPGYPPAGTSARSDFTLCLALKPGGGLVADCTAP